MVHVGSNLTVKYLVHLEISFFKIPFASLITAIFGSVHKKTCQTYCKALLSLGRPLEHFNAFSLPLDFAG